MTSLLLKKKYSLLYYFMSSIVSEISTTLRQKDFNSHMFQFNPVQKKADVVIKYLKNLLITPLLGSVRFVNNSYSSTNLK